MAAQALQWLTPDGHLLIETSEHQVKRTSAIVAEAGLTVRTVHDDELDGTVVVGSLRRGTRTQAVS